MQIWPVTLKGRKSTSGYLFTFVGGAISWQSKLQKMCGFIHNGDRVYSYHRSWKRDTMDKGFFQRTWSGTSLRIQSDFYHRSHARVWRGRLDGVHTHHFVSHKGHAFIKHESMSLHTPPPPPPPPPLSPLFLSFDFLQPFLLGCFLLYLPIN